MKQQHYSYIPIRFRNIFAGTQQGNSYGFGGGFLWVRIMEDDISEHSNNFCWVRFAWKFLASNLLYRFKRMKEEPGFLIQQKKKIQSGTFDNEVTR
jgi:hypothetical protein